MKKLTLLCLFICTSHFLSCQKRLHYGFELNLNGCLEDADDRDILMGLNAFALYDRYELYSGFDLTRINEQTKRVWGFEAGFKYHVLEKERRSHFYIDLNFQRAKYFIGCYNTLIPRASLNGNCQYISEIKTRFMTAGLGYEMFYFAGLSASLSIGPGINWCRTSGKDKTERDLYFVYLFKGSIRYTF